MRIYLDANVLFSAAKSDGAVRALLEQLVHAGHTLDVDTFVIAEAHRNLEVKKAPAVRALEEILDGVETAPLQPIRDLPELEQPLPEKDRPVLSAAISLRCQVLVTGDRTHFGPLFGKTVSGVTIHTPRSLAESVLF